MSRRAAIVTLATGFGMVVIAQVVAPLGSPPLYDGVVVQEPYRYLAPAAGQAGSPTSYHGTVPVTGAISPPFVGATDESPPQAQLIAEAGAFVLPAGTTSLAVSIEPVAPPVGSSGGSIVGNVYRVSVAAPSGTALAIDPASPPTLTLRAPEGAPTVTVERFADGHWQALTTVAGGQPGIVLANVTALGDYALIAPSQDPIGIIVSGLSIAITFLVVVGVFLFLRDRKPSDDPGSEAPAARSSTKRRSGGRRRRGSR